MVMKMKNDIKEIKNDIKNIDCKLNKAIALIEKSNVVVFGYEGREGLVQEVNKVNQKVGKLDKIVIKLITSLTIIYSGVAAAIKFIF